jgi:hypothetical protein
LARPRGALSVGVRADDLFQELPRGTTRRPAKARRLSRDELFYQRARSVKRLVEDQERFGQGVDDRQRKVPCFYTVAPIHGAAQQARFSASRLKADSKSAGSTTSIRVDLSFSTKK